MTMRNWERQVGEMARWLMTLSILLGQALLVAALQHYEFDTRHMGERVVDAINCGGNDHVDSNQVRYRRDPLEGRQGVASDFGRRLIIHKAHQDDQLLFQTERYAPEDFTYDLKLDEATDGDYVLVLRFSEVYFNSDDEKVFDVRLNHEHDIVTDLDIHRVAGKAHAHDVHVAFALADRQVLIDGQSSPLHANTLPVTFLKGRADNPKINALYLLRGTLNDLPRAPTSIEVEEVDEEVETEDIVSHLASGPPLEDPYETMDPSFMYMPILVALACFFPVLYCMCKV